MFEPSKPRSTAPSAGMAQPSIVEQTIGRRASWALALVMPVLAVLAAACWNSRVGGLAIQLSNLLLFVLVLAASVPKELPRGAVPCAACACAMYTALTVLGARSKWHDLSLTFEERTVRVSVYILAVGHCIQVTYSVVSLRPFWRTLRLNFAIFFAARSIAVGALRAWCSPATYPPGQLDFVSSTVCSFCSMLIFVSMTPTLRLWLSEVTGCAKIVVSLTDITALELALAQKQVQTQTRSLPQTPSLVVPFRELPLDPEPRAAAAAAAAEISTSETTSGPYAGEAASLWSGWSASWSDAGESFAAKLSRGLGDAPLIGLSFAAAQREIRMRKAPRAGKGGSGEGEAPRSAPCQGVRHARVAVVSSCTEGPGS